MPNPTHQLVPLQPFPVEIVVELQVHPDAKRFTISLCKGKDFNEDTSFTFDIRFDAGVVVRNHYKDGWGAEDRHGGFPFAKGQNFEIRIYVKNDLFQFFVNKQHFCDFNHRLPKETARNLLVTGDITILNISFPGSGGSGQHHSAHKHENPPVPLNIPIASLPGHKIVIAGIPTGDRFTVNLKCGPGDNHDIALHYDVRFKYGNSHNQVVLNTLCGGNWGSEDTQHQSFPFVVGQPFEIVIKAKDECFKITVNDEKFDNYNYCIKPDKVTHLNIWGDVILNYVKA